MYTTDTLKWAVASAVVAGGLAAVGARPAAATARADDDLTTARHPSLGSTKCEAFQ